ncbi:MAG TPA: hypothetical protein VG015_01375 [Candidatus Dormibacteraeota bacterium]|jgi:cell division protein FtsB|nr:hypothetical protein [Candidatus Dormibacteraeota bacterium]
MRHSKAGSTAGILSSRVPRRVERLVLVFLGILILWVVYALAPEAQFYRRVMGQEAAIKRQNDALAQENLGYERDIAAVLTGASIDADARQNGYAKPGDQVYVVGGVPSPIPSHKAVPAAPGNPPKPPPSPPRPPKPNPSTGPKTR